MQKKPIKSSLRNPKSNQSSFVDDQSAIPSEPRGTEKQTTETAQQVRQMKYKMNLMTMSDYKSKRKNTDEVHRLICNRHNRRNLLISRISGGRKKLCTLYSPYHSYSDESALAGKKFNLIQDAPPVQLKDSSMRTTTNNRRPNKLSDKAVHWEFSSSNSQPSILNQKDGVSETREINLPNSGLQTAIRVTIRQNCN